MNSVGLFEAKQKLSELVDRACKGEKIGITRRGKLAAVLTAAPAQATLKDIFKDIEEIRKRARSRRHLKIKDFIEEGRI